MLRALESESEQLREALPLLRESGRLLYINHLCLVAGIAALGYAIFGVLVTLLVKHLPVFFWSMWALYVWMMGSYVVVMVSVLRRQRRISGLHRGFDKLMQHG